MLPFRIGRSRSQALVIDWAHEGVSGHHVGHRRPGRSGVRVRVHGDNGVTRRRRCASRAGQRVRVERRRDACCSGARCTTSRSARSRCRARRDDSRRAIPRPRSPRAEARAPDGDAFGADVATRVVAARRSRPRRRAARIIASTKTATARSTASRRCSRGRRRRRRRDGVVGQQAPRGARASQARAARASTPTRSRKALLDADREIAKGIAHHSGATGAATVALCAGDRRAARDVVDRVGRRLPHRIASRTDERRRELVTRDDTYRHLGEEPPPGGSLDDPARMIGNGAVSAPNIERVDLGWDEMLVLCSDGVHKYVDAAAIGAVLRDDAPLARRCLRLVEAARSNGSQDDATVLVVHRGRAARAVRAHATRHCSRASRRRSCSWRCIGSARSRRASRHNGVRAMTPDQIDRVFGRGRLKMVTGEHVEVFREAARAGRPPALHQALPQHARRRLRPMDRARVADPRAPHRPRHRLRAGSRAVRPRRARRARSSCRRTMPAPRSTSGRRILPVARDGTRAAPRVRGLRALVGARASLPARAVRDPRAFRRAPRHQGRQRLHSRVGPPDFDPDARGPAPVRRASPSSRSSTSRSRSFRASA